MPLTENDYTRLSELRLLVEATFTKAIKGEVTESSLFSDLWEVMKKANDVQLNLMEIDKKGTLNLSLPYKICCYTHSSADFEEYYQVIDQAKTYFEAEMKLDNVKKQLGEIYKYSRIEPFIIIKSQLSPLLRVEKSHG